MSDNELRAAAVRVVAYAEGHFLAHRGDALKGLLDAEKVARAYLADHPADDGEPADEAWLRAAGFLPDGDPDNGDIAKKIWSLGESEDFGTEPAMHFIRNVKDGSSWLESYSPGGLSLCIIQLEPKPTRGHVRRLLAALGIPAGG